MGVERSEQNNPVSCFVNGDRRILRDVTKNQIQNIEQNSRTTPRGNTRTSKSELFRDKGTVRIFYALKQQYRNDP